MEEDAYSIAANLGLEGARAQLYRLEENSGGDFAEFRQKTLDVLRSIALALSNSYHRGNLHLVRETAALLAVDWTLPQDVMFVGFGYRRKMGSKREREAV